MNLQDLRKEIDKIDGELTSLFCRRMEISLAVGEYKKKNSLPVFDCKREEEKIEAIKALCPDKFKDAAAELYGEIFRLSREVQRKKCGLLGRTLGHSYSPLIHSMLSDYEYKLYEKEPEEVEDFLKNGSWDGLNVTIPYKKTVIQYCDRLSERAAKIGSVNTLVKGPDGSIYGDNTDAYGFELLIKKLAVPVKGRKAIVLGSGGASAAIKTVLLELGVSELKIISRTGEDNYENLSRHYDAEIIVNTTPLGTFPDNGKAAINLKPFTECKAVFDLVYNPARTALIMQAEELKIPCASGLYMLVAQAKRSSELFSGREIEDGRIQEISSELSTSMQNIVLIGMPGSGKSTIGAELARLSGRQLYDSDKLIAEKAGMSIAEIFEKYGENKFRELETEVLEEISKLSGVIISSGGGAVTRKENYPLLHQNSGIFWIKRDLKLLSCEGRPLSLKRSAEEIYIERKPLYEAFSDYIIENNSSPESAAKEILEKFK